MEVIRENGVWGIYFGDNTDRNIRFHGGSIADFAGKPVVLEFEMTEADVYAFKFQ